MSALEVKALRADLWTTAIHDPRELAVGGNGAVYVGLSGGVFVLDRELGGLLDILCGGVLVLGGVHGRHTGHLSRSWYTRFVQRPAAARALIAAGAGALAAALYRTRR